MTKTLKDIMFDKEGITAIIQTKENPEELEETIQILKPYVDEIIANIDSRNPMECWEVAKKYGVRVIIADFPGSFARLRNMAAEAASYTWIFTCDCDWRYEKDALINLRNLIKENCD